MKIISEAILGLRSLEVVETMVLIPSQMLHSCKNCERKSNGYEGKFGECNEDNIYNFAT